MKRSMMYLLLAGGMVLGTAKYVVAQDPSTSDNNQMDNDKAFLKNAATGGMAEVKLGQLAAQKASSPDVKAFAQKMVDDHTTLNNSMQPIADRMGVKAPTKLDRKDQAEYDRLNALSGDEFDKAYVKAMVMDHRKDLHDFKMEASMTNDTQLKQAVTDGEKVISDHYEMVTKLASQVGVGGAKSDPTAAAGR